LVVIKYTLIAIEVVIPEATMFKLGTDSGKNHLWEIPFDFIKLPLVIGRVVI